MKSNDFFNYCKVSIYGIKNLVKDDLILLDLKNSTYILNINLSKIYNLLVEEYPEIFVYLNKNDDEGNLNDILDKIKELKTKFDRDKLMEIINLNSKTIFSIFKQFVMSQKKVINGISFKPINERIITINNELYFNTYFSNIDFNNIKSTKDKKFPHFEKLLLNICGDNETYEYFTKFLAYKIQNPLNPIDTHFIIQDDGGTGKSKILSQILSRLINTSIISQGEIESAFNSYLLNSLLIIAEEIEGYENEKQIKYLTSVNSTICINQKFKASFNIINYTNWIFLSNDLKTIKLSEKDRRFIVMGGGKRLTPLKENEWNLTLFKDTEDNYNFFDSENGYHNSFEKELQNYYAYLIGLKINKKDLLVNLPTHKKIELIKQSYTSEILFIEELIEIKIDGLLNEYEPTKDLNKFIYHNSNDDGNKGYWIKNNDLYSLYKKFCIHNGYNSLTQNNFARRIQETQNYKNIFEDKKKIRINDKTFRCLKLKSYVDENKELI